MSLVQDGNNVKQSSFYNVDPTLSFSFLTTKSATFNASASNDLNYVILGDVVNWWGHALNSRGEGFNTTSGNHVVNIIKNPSGGTVSTVNTDTFPDATNANTAGWTPAQAFNPTSPAGNWTWNGTLTFNGVVATQTLTITFITPLTSNLVTRIIGPILCKPGQSVRFYYQTEINDVPTTPETLPTYKASQFALPWTDFASGNMLNAQDNTATINGAQYYVDVVAPATPGRYNFFAKAQLNGNGIRSNVDFRVSGNAFDVIGFQGGPP